MTRPLWSVMTSSPPANRHVAQPVIVSSPILAAGGVIEGDQRFPVRFGRGLRHRGLAMGRWVLAGESLCLVGPAVPAGVGPAVARGVAVAMASRTGVAGTGYYGVVQSVLSSLLAAEQP